ncbi:hypothetical protein BH11PAT1_BH11PAT1_0280 [soil metagenome]
MKIPPHAKRVFQGTIFEVYQWDQEMFDGSSATFEALKRPDTIQIIPTNKDTLFLSHEEQPNKPLSYCFLGGRQEEGEEPLVVAKRELLEESGMESDDWELLKTYESEGKIQWTTYFFVARNAKKITVPHLDPGEKITVEEVSFEQFLAILDRDDFWGKNIAHDIHMLTHDTEKLTEFKKKLFV